MGSMRVVMLGVFTQNPRQVSAPEDEHVIQHLSAHPSDQPLDVSVGLGRPVRGEPDLDALGRKDLIEAATVLGIAIVHQETHPQTGVVIQVHHQVAGLLGHPGRVGVGAHPEAEDPAGLQVHERQHVQGVKEDRLDGEEVAGDDALGLGAKELTPVRAVRRGAGPRPARRRVVRIVVAETTSPRP